MENKTLLLEILKERLANLYNDLCLSNEEYIEKKKVECNSYDIASAYAIKAGQARGTLDALLSLMND